MIMKNYLKVINMNSIEKIKNYCEFAKGECYILSVMARRKNNDDITHTTEVLVRKTLLGEDDVEKAYNYLKSYALRDKEHVYYMYISLNPRNIRKAVYLHQHKLLELMERMETEEGAERQALKMTGLWYSQLESPKAQGNKKRRYLMVDLDDKNIIDEVLDVLKHYTTTKAIHESVNGYHIVCKPFDIREVEKYFNETYGYDDKGNPWVTFKRDCLLFIEVFNNDKD